MTKKPNQQFKKLTTKIQHSKPLYKKLNTSQRQDIMMTSPGPDNRKPSSNSPR
jgi:hypothetical protein